VSGSPDGQKFAGDGNVQADNKDDTEINVEDKETTHKGAAQQVGTAVAHDKYSAQNVEREQQEVLDAAADKSKEKTDTIAADDAVGKRTAVAAGTDARGANGDKQENDDDGDKKADEDAEQREGGDGAEIDEKKAAGDDEDEKEEDEDRRRDYDNGDDQGNAGDDQKAQADGVGGVDQKVQPSAPDVKSGPEKTSGKDVDNDNNINYDDNREFSKNDILNKASRAGDNSEYEHDDNPYDDDREADEQGREPSNRWAEEDDDEDDEDEHYVAGDDAGYGADAKDAGMDFKLAEHSVHEPSKEAQGSDSLRSTLLGF